MSTTRKAVYLALGAGDLALEKAKGLPQQVSSFSNNVISEVATRAGTIPRTLRGVQDKMDADQLRRLLEQSRRRADEVYSDLARRGELVTRRVKRTAAVKEAADRNKIARAKVKGATSSVQRAAKANARAAAKTVEKVVEAG